MSAQPKVILNQSDYYKLVNNANKLYVEGGPFKWKNLIIWIMILLLLNAVLWSYSYYIKPMSGYPPASGSSLFAI